MIIGVPKEVKNNEERHVFDIRDFLASILQKRGLFR